MKKNRKIKLTGLLLVILIIFTPNIFFSKGNKTKSPAEKKTALKGKNKTKSKIPANYCISPEERKLYKLINKYRKSLGLSKIPFSKSLSYVAHKHVVDLADKIGYLTHAWSSCKYNGGDSKTWPCMWDKPRQLTNYSGDGFECAQGGYGAYTPSAEGALSGWKSSKAHHAVIINQGTWKSITWKALGVGLYKNYAVIWFGREADPAGRPKVCNK
jgi:uncharacterized protein YkwD